jgi:glycosyltransferase involved in cell wall biosynthesis
MCRHYNADVLSVSFVLLAYDEEGAIGAAIEDCRAFGRAHLSAYEIIVVDDGSRDRTRAIAEAAGNDVRVVVHPVNRGMGASMRDGYLAARMDYIAHLPGDRQVRPDALLPMLARAAPDRVVLSVFENPPSGRARAVMSIAFRQLTRHVGNMRVNFAGTYLFHRTWLTRVALARADSDTFLFSFQLLELMRRSGAHFETVTIRTYPRDHGQSREATVRRIARMFLEIARARLGTGS